MDISSGDESGSKVPSKYSLVIAVSKRAKQLREGAPRLVESKSRNPITVAMEEIAQGKVKIIIPTAEQIVAASRRQELMPTGRPKAKQAAELLRVEDFDVEEEAAEEETEEAVEVSDEAAEPESAEEFIEDEDEEIRPLDELVGNPGESETEELETEE